ncbi:MAG: RNA polymerase sigma factor [Lapillicoccus sp.]
MRPQTEHSPDGTPTDQPPQPTMEVLVRRAALGDRAAFALIVGHHGAGMFRYALRMLEGDHHAAEDAVQEALIDAWVHLPTFRAESSLRTWLFRITANRVLASRRRHRPIAVDDQLLSTRPEPDHQGPSAEVQHGQLWETLELALSELPWRQRASWLLREMEGLSYEDIASILETSPTVVRGQLHRARRTLAIRMEQWR